MSKLMIIVVAETSNFLKYAIQESSFYELHFFASAKKKSRRIYQHAEVLTE